jgi:hypothetical protein
MSGDYALYIDDIGSGKPGNLDSFKFFALGGFLINRIEEDNVRNALREFKAHWSISGVPLHGAEIRSKKKNFSWLGLADDEQVVAFKTGILDLVLSQPIAIHACVIDRAGYYERYHAKYGRNTWEMRKSAFAILLERAVKFVLHMGGKSLTVYFEKAGGTEDSLNRTTYENLRNAGHPFDHNNAAKYKPLAASDLSDVLAPDVYADTKDNLLLQLADLCLYPVATARDGRVNVGWQRFIDEKRLVDAIVGDDLAPTMGIKFYCFDAPKTETPPSLEVTPP